MNVKQRAYLLLYTSGLLCVGGQWLLLKAAGHFGLGAFAIIVLVLSYMVMLLLMLFKVNQIRCRSCHKPYGVIYSLFIWPLVPRYCQHCGIKLDEA